MELELMNIFHLYMDNKTIVIRVNATKKQLTELLKEYAKENDTFRPVKFRSLALKKGFKLYYE